jgi:hypothetical protein
MHKGKDPQTNINIKDTPANVNPPYKIALCVGLNNYPNPANTLRGCVNDANDWAALLKNIYNFNEIYTIFNQDATLKNVTDTISKLLAKTPDIFVMTNSSHGTSLPDTSGTEPDGRSEAICLYDGFLMDYNFRTILAQASAKTNVTIVSDSCHSAGVTREFLSVMNDMTFYSKPRYMPPEDNQEALHLASLPLARAIFEPEDGMKEVLLAACKSDQYSFDTEFNDRPNGAFSYFAIQMLKSNPTVTYADFVNKMNQYLPSSNYPQCPVVQCSPLMEQKIIFS